MSQRWARKFALASALTLLGSIVALVPSSPVSAGPGDSPPMAVWRRDGSTNPRYNPWDGSTFGVTQDSASVGEFRTIKGAEAPTRDEAIVLGMTDSGTVAGEIWDGTSWSALPFNNLVTGRVAWNWGLATAYGSLSGDGVIVWNNGTTGTAGLSYRVWNGTAWSSAQTITTPRSGEPVHLMMAANPQSDEMTLVVSNSAGEDYAIIWDGATWGNSVTLDAGGGDSFDIDVAYEQLSGTAVVVDAQGANSIVRRWNGTVWSGTETVTRPGGMSGNPRWNRLAGDPTSDNITLGVRTYNADIWLATHDGTSWTAIAGASGTPSGNYPGIDVAFEGTSGQVVAAYGVSGNSVAYRTWSSGGGWSSQTVGPNIGAVPNSLTLFADPATDDIMLATNDAANDINMTLWNGSAWATPTELETTSGLADYQPFFFLWNAPTAAQSGIVVNSTGDTSDVDVGNGVCETSTAGECTLRAAIEEANALAGTDSINFNIPTSDPNYTASPEFFTIQPATLLPAISTPMILDASTQPEYATNSRPVIEVDGTNVSSGEENGFYLTGGGTTLRGFVINNWGDDAIDIEFNGGNTIVGNYVGTNVTGTAAEPNAWGINFKTGGNIIGGTTADDRNVVSGNTFDGFYIYNASATGNVVQGNYVGTNAAGTAAVANERYGLYIHTGANGNTIGGATPAHGNVISGNGTGDDGIRVEGSATSGNIVRYNRIGTNASGTAAIPNNLHGLRINDAPNTQVLDNLISGNDVHGLYVNSTGATGTQILRNTIGTNLAETYPVPNGFDGVRIEGWANGATIGSPGNGNVIAGNSQHGINLNNSNNNTIQSNSIGTNSGGAVDLGNTLSGIYNDAFGSSNNLVGGAVVGEGNTIAFNGEGITFLSGTDNAIIGNNIYANDSLGIDYDDDGVTANSNADAWVNYPENISATETAGTITLNFDLDLPAGDYRIELFKNPGGADPTTFGEGETYVDSHDVVSHPGGLASYSTTTAGTVGDILTTTATEVSAGPVYGATSEFSAAQVVSTCTDSDSDGLCDLEEDANTDADDDPATNPGPNTDGDANPNYLDADDDGDGIPTASENADPNGDGDPRDAQDSDHDGQPDWLDLPTTDSGGTVATEQKISATVGGLSGALDNSDLFGSGATPVGDLDRDGIVDLAIGIRADDDGGTDRGAVYILFLNANGTVKAEQKISDTQGGLAATLDNGDNFGDSLAGLGDLDGDGINDLAVGAPSDDDGGTDRGAVHILFLNANGTVKAEQKISDTQGSLAAALDNSDRFGDRLAGLGDIDGDGINDLAVGAPLDGDGGTERGAVHILFLNANGTVKAEQKVSDTQGGLAATLDNSDWFGIGLAGIGDVDGDGVGDLAAGARTDDDGGSDRGAVHILFLNTNGTVKAEQKISDTQGGLAATLANGDFFGNAVPGVGDLDLDGIADIVVTAPRADDGGSDRGAVHILFLNANGTVKAEQKISSTSGGFTGPLDTLDWFGDSIAALGDLDGDGTIGIAIGASTDDDGGADRGAVYVLQLGSQNTPPVLDPVGAQSVDENVLLAFAATATDTDLPAQVLTFALQDGVDSVPAGAAITAGGAFTWTPSEAQGGNTYSFKIRVTDNGTGSLFDEEEIVFTLNDTNVAPTLAAVGDKTVIEATPLSFTISGTDTDNPADTLTYTAIGLPAGATLNPSTGAFAWTPTAAQGPGSYPVTFTVTDDGTGTLADSEAITITVDEPALSVNSTGDGSDANPGNGLCDTGGLNSEGATECTLRAAIEEANGFGGANEINFNMPTTETGHSGGVWTITPGSQLPNITQPVTLDATTQTGWTSTPVVELNGTGAGASSDGFRVFSDATVIRGFAINRFPADGIEIDSSATNTLIESNHIGLDATGLIDRGNTGRGIDLQVGSGPTTVGGVLPIRRNVVSGNGDDGIIVFGSDSNVIIGNFIGTDVTGVASGPGIGNATDGIVVANGSADNTIGQAGAGNVLSGNANDGLEIDDVTGPNTIQANMIGLGYDGDTPIPNGRYGIVLYNGANNNQIGGNVAGEGNVISANTVAGVTVDGNANPATANNDILGNLIGTDVTGTLDRGNGGAGIDVFGRATANTIGGTAPADRNIISKNGGYGIRIDGPGTDANIVAANYVGIDISGTVDLGNASDGIAIRNGAQRNVIGGLSAGERNIIAGNDNDGVWITGSGTTDNIVRGNWVGYGTDGSSLPNSYHGIAIENAAADNLVGGDVVAASNRIGNSLWDGVAVAGGTGSGNAILGNSIVGNVGLGIDLENDGVTPNDSGDGDAGPNDLMNFPEITSARELAGTVTADFDLDVPTGSYRIEFFANPSGPDPTGYGEGEVFVHAQTVAHSGGGVEAFSTTFAGSAGQVITATATRILPGPTYSATSEFSQAVTIVPAVIAMLSGSVFEDVNGDGDVLDDGVGTPNVEVSIYLDQGDGEPNLGDTPVTSTVTDASGDWSVTVNGNGTYWVSVDSADIAPAAGYNPPFGIGDVWAEQTFGSAGAGSYDGSAYSFAVSAGPLFGGMNAGQPDGFPSLAAAEHLHRAVVTGSDITGIDSGFSFQVVTNTVDDLDPAQHQGSLRQFIENSEAVVGVQTSQFVIPQSDPGYSASPVSYTVRPVADLPTITDQAIIDGTTQSEFAGTPIVELDGSLAGPGASGLTVNSTATSVSGFVINRFGIGISVVGGVDNVIAGNYLGPDVTGLAGQVGNIVNGLYIANATGTVVGGSAASERNVISGNRLRGVFIDDVSDGPAPVSSGTLIVGNYIGTDAVGTARLPFDGSGGYQQIGISLWDGPGTTIGGAAVGEFNVISGNDWYGVYMWGPNATGNTVQGNIVGLDALASSAVGNGADNPTTRAGIYVNNAPGNLIGGTGAGEGNIIAGNDAGGVIIQAGGAVGNSILGNEIHGNNGIGIDLGTDGVTLNDPLDADSGENDWLNFPDLSQATAAGGTVSLDVQLDVPAGDYRIEFFANPSGADPSGYGEGETLRHSELIAHPGGGAQTYRVSFPGSPGDALSATTTELLAGPTYGSTSEFARIVVVATSGDIFIDSSERRSDMTEVGTVDPVAGKAGIGARLSGAGERLVGPATDLVSGELTMSAWVNATSLGTDPRVIAKASTASNATYELLIDDATFEAVARLDVGGSTAEVRGGLVGTGTWHQLLATWDGSTITLYVDGVAVDSAPAAGALATDLTVPLVVGNIATGTRSFIGTVDHVRVSHVAQSQAWVSTTFSNVDDPGSFVSIGGAHTGLPGLWSASATTSRTGSFALAAPETVGGADAWATAIGLDEPGVEFEAWWQLSDPANVDAAAGTRTGAAATDQNETALSGSVFDLGSVVGSTRTQEAVSATGAPTATWVKVVIRTDETGISSVWIDDLLAIGLTLHVGGQPTGSVGLRVGELPSGETWHIDDVQLRRFVSDEPVATLGPLDRN